MFVSAVVFCLFVVGNFELCSIYFIPINGLKRTVFDLIVFKVVVVVRAVFKTLVAMVVGLTVLVLISMIS